ncbi:MAG: WbqC family protein [Deltaproteobacteria bacterium]|nr:WbqC family protein [Candidatus Zymogenaceae bacterium]
MIVAVHQPQYMAWGGYFHKMDTADAFVFLDTVQYKKNEFQNRNLIKGPRGPQWLTVPVLYRFGQTINEVMINNSVPWARKHLAALVSCYGRAPFFARYIGDFEKLLTDTYEGISELNIAAAQLIARLLGIETALAVASDLPQVDNHRDRRLVEIVKLLGGDTYLSGAGGREYIDEDVFKEGGVKLSFQEFCAPNYPQLFGAFAPNLSIIDLVFNIGPNALDYLRGTVP